MCGIAGFIGQSKKPKSSYDLITSLFDNLESRGTDASGFWATETSCANQGRVIYQKEPIKSSEFIKNKSWTSLKKMNLDLMIVHARATSKGGGNAIDNFNNHPFVSSDKKIALAHNGTLEEADFLQQKYETISDTDSELLLRIYEHGLEIPHYTIDDVPSDIAKKVSGIKDIWSYVSSGAMSVAIGERIDDNTRGLFLFRNEKRPMWIADMRKVLGQVFFFSTPEIWHHSIASCKELNRLCWDSQKLIELPPFQVWYMSIDKEDPIITDENLFKFEVKVIETGREFEKGEYCKIKGGKAEFSVVSIVEDETKNQPINRGFPTTNILGHKPELSMKKGYHTHRHDVLYEAIKEKLEKIDTEASNLCTEGSISTSDYDMLVESLSQIHLDIDGTLRILTRS